MPRRQENIKTLNLSDIQSITKEDIRIVVDSIIEDRHEFDTNNIMADATIVCGYLNLDTMSIKGSKTFTEKEFISRARKGFTFVQRALSRIISKAVETYYQNSYSPETEEMFTNDLVESVYLELKSIEYIAYRTDSEIGLKFAIINGPRLSQWDLSRAIERSNPPLSRLVLINLAITAVEDYVTNDFSSDENITGVNFILMREFMFSVLAVAATLYPKRKDD